jgi:NADPH:quinone reductase-like Zn-dependent oxidoreductase
MSLNRPLMEMAWKQLSEWVEAGKLRPVIGKVFLIEDARSAYTLIQEGKNYGKIVLKMA